MRVLISNITKYFSTSSPKVHNSGNFCSKFKDFGVCIKLCKKTNSRALVSNMTIMFYNSSPKVDIFGPKSKNLFFLYKTLHQSKFEGADFKYDKGFSKMFLQEYPNNSFLVPHLSIFLFLQNSAIRLIGESWIQIWEKFFKILAQQHPSKAFLNRNLGVFVFSENFAVRQSRGYWFQIWQNNFQLPVQKYPNQPFLFPNWKISVFASNFVRRKIRGRWFQI